MVYYHHIKISLVFSQFPPLWPLPDLPFMIASSCSRVLICLAISLSLSRFIVSISLLSNF